MKKQRNNQGSSDFTNQDVFADFNPPRTTDGSYKGTMKRVKATEAHLEAKFQEKFEETNQRLKDAKTRVSITRKGNSLQLQATLPPKPGSDKVKPYQQLISLGTPANLAGLQTAWEDATELGKLLARKQFEWNEKYLGNKIEEVKTLTIGELLDRFKDEFFKTHPYNEKIDRRCNQQVIARIKHHCDTSKFPTSENFVNFIRAVPTDGAREGLMIAIKTLISTFKLNVDISGAKFKITRNRRMPPSDLLIEQSYDFFEKHALNRIKQPNNGTKDTWKLKSWLYGMLATFGLRPHELLMHPDITWWLSHENVDDTWKVHKDCKTGEREAFPLHQKWIEAFDLKNLDRLNELKEVSTKIVDSEDMEFTVSNLSQYFKKVNISFKPYDLRHAWAIRAHMMGIPIKAAADNLGHSVDMHTSTYQRWFGRDNRKIAINAAIAKKTEIDLLKEENIQLKLENERLKIENERYRLMSIENQHLNG